MKREFVAVAIFLVVVASLGAVIFLSGENHQTATSTQNSNGCRVQSTFDTTSKGKPTSEPNSESPLPIESVETANVSIGGAPRTIAVNPDRSRIYIEDYFSDNLTVVDASSHTVLTRIRLPAAANNGIAVDCGSGTVYALVQNGVAVVNGTTNTVVKELPLDFGPGSLAYNPTTHTLFGSPESGNGSLVGADAQTGSIVMNVPLEYWANSVAVDPQTNIVTAVGCRQDFECNSVASVVNATSGKLVNQITIGNFAYPRVTLDPVTHISYVSGSAQLVAINEMTGKVIYDINSMACGVLDSMVVGTTANQVLAVSLNYNYLLAYDGTSGALLNMYRFPNSPQFVTYNPSSNEVYATTSTGQLIIFPNTVSTGHVNSSLVSSDQNCPLP